MPRKQYTARRTSAIGDNGRTFGAMLAEIQATRPELLERLTGRELGMVIDVMYSACRGAKAIALATATIDDNGRIVEA